MNKVRRKRIFNVSMLLSESNMKEMIEELQSILDDEEYAFDSMPENLQYSMRGEESQEAIDCLNNAIDMLQSIIDGDDEYDLDDVVSEIDMI